MTINESDALKALDLYADELLTYDNVQGVGVGSALVSPSEVEYFIIVYLGTAQETVLPDCLEVSSLDGEFKKVPVRTEVQGVVEPEGIFL